MSSSAKVFLFTCLLLHVSMQVCSGSAIPIWEFLTRNEKLSYLYSTFAQLVSVHCKATAAASNEPVNQCKRNLLGYGYEKLQTFTEAELDAFDPYQRGANELIWLSIMREHPSAALVSTRKPLPISPATSIIVLSEQKPSTVESDSVDSSTNTQQYPKNPLFDNDAEHKHQYAMDMDIAYGYAPKPFNHVQQVETFVPPPTQQQQQQSSSTTNTKTEQKTYLTGPLVFRVRPDGTPVEEDLYKPLPRDDDLDALRQSTATTLNNSGTYNQAGNNSGNSVNKHRRIATISALKQQHLATLALQQELQAPAAVQQRSQRHYPTVGNYYFPRAQA